MTTSEIDTGARCEAHVGEVFPPRCVACDAERSTGRPVPRSGYFPGAECAAHAGYPVPCPRCARDAADGLPIAVVDHTPNLERRVRSNDPDTSWDAAKITRRESTDLQKVLHSIIALHGPLTDEEIFAHYRANGGSRTPQRVRTARAELSRPITGRPLIREYDRDGITATGAAARRWVIA